MTHRVPRGLVADFTALAQPDLHLQVEVLVRWLWDKGREDQLRVAVEVLRASREALAAHRADSATRVKDDAIRVAARRRGDPPVTWRDVTVNGRTVRVGRARHEHVHWRAAPLPIGRGNPEHRIRAAARADLRTLAGLSVRAAALLVRASLK
jgi:hypothetical protein